MKKQISIFLATLMLAGVLSGCSSTDETEVVEEVTVSATSVEVKTVGTSDIANTVKLSGKIAANREVSVYSMMTADVVNLSVEVGDRVEKDEFLFSVEEYDVDDLVREINNLKKTYDSTKALLDEAVTQISDALEDTRALYEVGAASRYEVEQLEFSLSQQESTNQTQLDSLQNSLDSMYSQLADINEYSVVFSPIAGVVTQVNLIENMMASNAYAAVVIADDSQMKVDISASETLVPYLTIGDTVSVTIPSVSTAPFEATIGNVSPSTNVQTGMYTVTINLPTDQEYFIGMFAEVTFITDNVVDTINVPSSSIIIGDEYNYVFVVSSDNVASRVIVETGITDGNYTQILSGLSGGEQLVVTGQEYLSDSSLVNITGGN
ncbi:MAG: efflux RND transporter periplasmic adaptor subunit [Clostridia bacterium]